MLEHLSAREGRVSSSMQGEWAGQQRVRQARHGGVLTAGYVMPTPLAPIALEPPKWETMAGVRSGPVQLVPRIGRPWPGRARTPSPKDPRDGFKRPP